MMRQFMDIIAHALNEARHFGQSFEEIARQYATWEEFLHATDGLDVLYRGHHGDGTDDHSFMTDYVGHAANYADDADSIDGFAFNPTDVLYFNDETFECLRDAYRGLSNPDLVTAYRAALNGNRHAAEFSGAIKKVKAILHSDTPYEDICGIPEENDPLVPLLQQYAAQQGKNIIAFHGSDYADYGGQTEYVVGDVSKLADLRKLYQRVHHNI